MNTVWGYESICYAQFSEEHRKTFSLIVQKTLFVDFPTFLNRNHLISLLFDNSR